MKTLMKKCTGIKSTLSATLVSQSVFLFISPLSQAGILLWALMRIIGHDSQDKRWTLPFCLLCLFDCEFVWAVSQREWSIVFNDKPHMTVCACVCVCVRLTCFNCLNVIFVTLWCECAGKALVNREFRSGWLSDFFLHVWNFMFSVLSLILFLLDF